jgi:hypothetical protein
MAKAARNVRRGFADLFSQSDRKSAAMQFFEAVPA